MSYNFSLVQSDLSSSWSGITSRSSVIWACNRNGGSSGNYIYSSSNGGNTWNPVSNPTTFTPSTQHPFAIASNSTGTIVVIQSYFGSFVYNSGSGTWSSGNQATNTGFLGRGSAYITNVGDYAVVGTSFTSNTQKAQIIDTNTNTIIGQVTDASNYTYTNFSIAGSSNGSYLFFGIGGTANTGVAIASSNNLSTGSVTVSPILSLSTGTAVAVTSVACDTTGQYVVAVVFDGYYYSSNFGASWSSIQSFPGTGYTTSSQNSVCCVSSNGSSSSFAIAVGRDNAILLSSSAGATFTTAYTSPTRLSGNANVAGNNIGSNGTAIVAGAHDFAGSGFVVGSYTPPPVICFKEGSKILCLIDEQEIYVPIETIKQGTLVKTRLDGYKPVALIGTSKIYNPDNDIRGAGRLYELTQEKYPEITEDLILTGCHCILTETITDEERAGIIDVMKDVYVTDRKYRLPACVDERATPYQVEGVFSIWHLALEHDDMYMNYGIYANGLLVETTSKRMISQYSGMKLIEN